MDEPSALQATVDHLVQAGKACWPRTKAGRRSPSGSSASAWNRMRRAGGVAHPALVDTRPWRIHQRSDPLRGDTGPVRRRWHAAAGTGRAPWHRARIKVDKGKLALARAPGTRSPKASTGWPAAGRLSPARCALRQGARYSMCRTSCPAGSPSRPMRRRWPAMPRSARSLASCPSSNPRC